METHRTKAGDYQTSEKPEKILNEQDLMLVEKMIGAILESSTDANKQAALLGRIKAEMTQNLMCRIEDLDRKILSISKERDWAKSQYDDFTSELR